jgi:hypothetical protein
VRSFGVATTSSWVNAWCILSRHIRFILLLPTQHYKTTTRTVLLAV